MIWLCVEGKKDQSVEDVSKDEDAQSTEQQPG